MHEVDELLARVHVEFGVDVLGVGGGRLARDDESVAHVRYRSAARQEVEHLGLARGEAAAFGKLEDAGGQLVDIGCRRGRRCSFVGVRVARIRSRRRRPLRSGIAQRAILVARAERERAAVAQHEHGGAHQQRDGHSRHLVEREHPGRHAGLHQHERHHAQQIAQVHEDPSQTVRLHGRGRALHGVAREIHLRDQAEREARGDGHHVGDVRARGFPQHDERREAHHERRAHPSVQKRQRHPTRPRRGRKTHHQHERDAHHERHLSGRRVLP